MDEKNGVIAQSTRLRRLGQLDAAWLLLKPLLASGDSAVAEEAALVSEQMGKRPQAIALLERVTALSPNRTTAWVNLAAMRAESNDHRGAADAARVATRLAPRLIAAWINLGSALAALRDFHGSIDAFSRAVALEPGDPDLNVDLAAAEFSAGDVGSAARRLQSVVAANPGHTRAHSLLLLVLHHATNDAAGLAQAHFRFAVSHGVTSMSSMPSTYDQSRPLRVGLVSSDFRQHSVWYFLSSLLNHLPSLGIELHCFHTDTSTDSVTEVWRNRAAAFHDVSRLDDDGAAAEIRASHLDVLISLGGHTTSSRPTLFLRRLAPVQASFLGYPGPLGSPNVDYWIADAVVAEAYDAWGGGVGRVAALPGSYFCFQPLAATPARSAYGGDEPVVFGSFNVLAKISAVTVRLWAAVLMRVPGSRLMLKTDSVHGPVSRRIAAEFESLGVASDRIIWADWSASRDEHLARYHEIDIALDTFPYNGATTNCEALWMGVPVVSLVGNTPASRMGRSILTVAGLADWACDTEDQFVAIAEGLAARVTALREERGALRRTIEQSALCDDAAHARHVADLLKTISAG